VRRECVRIEDSRCELLKNTGKQAKNGNPDLPRVVGNECGLLETAWISDQIDEWLRRCTKRLAKGLTGVRFSMSVD
jgi:hypothetical protein